MVAILLRLRFSQTSNTLRRPPVQLFGMDLILLLAGILLVNVVRVFSGYTATEIVGGSLGGASTGTVLIGSAIMLSFLVIPLALAADDPLDPRTFSSLPVRPVWVAAGLAVGSLLRLPVIALAVVAIAHTAAWATHPDTTLVAVASAPVIVATGAVAARISRSLGALVFGHRHLRDFAGILAPLTVLTATPFVLLLLLGEGDHDLSSQLTSIAKALAGSPLGWAWAAPVHAAAGDSSAAWADLGFAVCFVIALCLLWYLLVARMMRMPAPAPAERRVSRRGLGWFELLPDSPTGAIAARSFSYWVRDGRYKFAFAVVPVVAILTIMPFLAIGVWWQNLALVPLPIMCLLLGWLPHNDLAHDNSALWLHVAANVSGRADRVGRIIPALTIGVPLILVMAPLSVWAYGDWSVLQSLFGVSFAVLLIGSGVSSWTSAGLPYAAVRPGSSPFAQPQSSGAATGQGVAFFVTVLLSLPILGLGALHLAFGGTWGLVCLACGVLWGALVLLLGVIGGARIFDRHAPELLDFALRN